MLSPRLTDLHAIYMDHERARIGVYRVPGVYYAPDAEDMNVAGAGTRFSVVGKRAGDGEVTVYSETLAPVTVDTTTRLEITDRDGFRWGEFRIAEIAADGTGQVDLRLEQQ